MKERHIDRSIINGMLDDVLINRMECFDSSDVKLKFSSETNPSNQGKIILDLPVSNIEQMPP